MSDDNESLDRENYEIINSLGNCPNCGARMGEERTQFGFQTICPVCQTVTKETHEPED